MCFCIWVHVYVCGHDACVWGGGVHIHVCEHARGDLSARACTYGVYICLCVWRCMCTCAGAHMHACGDLRWALGIFYHSPLYSLAKGLVSLN